MYAAAQAQSASEAPTADGETTGGADSTNGADDDVVDAEIVDDDQNTGTK
jgi:molecular chaperone DnaK